MTVHELQQLEADDTAEAVAAYSLFSTMMLGC